MKTEIEIPSISPSVKRYIIAGIIAAVLLQFIVGAVFIHRLGVLTQQERAWRAEVQHSKECIKALQINIDAKQAENKLLTERITAAQQQLDTLYSQIDNREVTLLEMKNYGQKTISTYLALPIDERRAAFTKLIGRR